MRAGAEDRATTIGGEAGEAAVAEGLVGDGAQPAAVGAPPLELTEALALGRPQEAPTVGQPARHLGIEVEPGVVALDQQGARLEAARVDGEHRELGLVPGLDDQTQRGAAAPLHVGEVLVARLVPADGAKRAAVDRGQVQLDLRVRRAGPGVAARARRLARIGRIHDVQGLDAGLVGALHEHGVALR